MAIVKLDPLYKDLHGKIGDLVFRRGRNGTDQMLAFLTLHRLPAETRQDPGFRAMLKSFTSLAEKDLAVTLEFARECGVELPGAAHCRELMARVYGLEE